jgi:hypothetical protein
MPELPPNHDRERASNLARASERMGLSERAPELRRIDTMDAAWRVEGGGRRASAVRQAAQSLRATLAERSTVLAVRTLPVSRLLYPTKFAFSGAARSLAPFVVMFHRALLVQFLQGGEVKHLLFNPTNARASEATPFFAHLLGKLPAAAKPLVAPPLASFEDQLGALGLGANDIDYVAFDHFHTQDLRPLLGTRDGAHRARFPRAKLLAPRVEWDDWADLHPMQRPWFVAEGRTGVDESKVVLTDGDVVLGDGVMLVRTPGHTSGNQTLFFRGPTGIWGCSENGTCADAWSPLDSKIAGLRAHCRAYGVDLVPNFNTPESGGEQWASMLLERTMVDRVAHAPAFVQMFASSEVTASPLAPGLAPTVSFGGVSFGECVGARAAG